MTCPNQLELGERKKAQKKLTDEPAKEGPHSVGVWTLKKYICAQNSHPRPWTLHGRFVKMTTTLLHKQSSIPK